MNQNSLTNALKRHGITVVPKVRSYELLQKFATNPNLPNIDITPREFLRDLYDTWKALGLNRTTRYFEKLAIKRGTKSGYHRITGRLNLDRKNCYNLMYLMLETWEENKPSAHHDSSLIGEFVDWLFTASLVEDRILKNGLEVRDLEWLILVSKELDRPITLQEIIPILKAKVSLDSNTK